MEPEPVDDLVELVDDEPESVTDEPQIVAEHPPMNAPEKEEDKTMERKQRPPRPTHQQLLAEVEAIKARGGKPGAELAAKYGVSQASIYNWISQARKEIGDMLAVLQDEKQPAAAEPAAPTIETGAAATTVATTENTGRDAEPDTREEVAETASEPLESILVVTPTQHPVLMLYEAGAALRYVFVEDEPFNSGELWREPIIAGNLIRYRVWECQGSILVDGRWMCLMEPAPATAKGVA